LPIVFLARHDWLEDVQVRPLVRTHALAKRIRDVGFAAFRTLLDGKAADAGRRGFAVPPADTSQECSGCGVRAPKSLSMRTQVCTACGLVVDRDENAAINMQRAGQALRALAGRPAAAGTNRASPWL
jgi:putative transposase